jgi:hypothetical protein
VIQTNDALQALECSICGELQEVMRITMRDQHALLVKKEEMATDHAGCEAFADDPERAKAERAWIVGMRRETKKAERRCRAGGGRR